MGITRKEIDQLSKIIRKLYLEDEIPWVIGYSGGKDSTATLQIVWNALMGLPEADRNRKAVHVISTDTLAESPIIARWVDKSHEKIKKQAETDRINIIAHKLIPAYTDTFWVNLIGRGYPYPRPNFRWCTDRMKIKPANKFVHDVVSEFGEVILLLGTRKAESAARARTMSYYEKLRVRDFLSPNGTMQNELIFSPLEDWSDDDVWTYLMQYKNPWGHSNKDLLTMYKGATPDSECPLVIDADTPSCGKSRFGCWVCTMVEQDKSMAAMIMNDSQKEWMTPLLEFRNEIGNAEEDRDRRDFRRMAGTAQMFHGRLVHGPYLKEVRENWLYKLLSIQTDIRTNGPVEFRDHTLITPEELAIIRDIWLNEKHEFDDSLPRIYEKATGEKYSVQKEANNTAFGKYEWDLLSDVIEELYPEESLLFEMTARIIDIEKKAAGQKNRRGVLVNIEKQIKRSFYRDETDALNYATTREKRKQGMGAEYNDKAFEQISINTIKEIANEN